MLIRLRETLRNLVVVVSSDLSQHVASHDTTGKLVLYLLFIIISPIFFSFLSLSQLLICFHVSLFTCSDLSFCSFSPSFKINIQDSIL